MLSLCDHIQETSLLVLVPVLLSYYGTLDVYHKLINADGLVVSCLD